MIVYLYPQFLKETRLADHSDKRLSDLLMNNGLNHYTENYDGIGSYCSYLVVWKYCYVLEVLEFSI